MTEDEQQKAIALSSIRPFLDGSSLHSMRTKTDALSVPHSTRRAGRDSTTSSIQLDHAQEDLNLNRLHTVEGLATDLLTTHGLTMARESTEYRRLCRELLKAQIHVIKTAMKRMDGDYSGEEEHVRASCYCPCRGFAECGVVCWRQPLDPHHLRSIHGGERPPANAIPDHKYARSFHQGIGRRVDV